MVDIGCFRDVDVFWRCDVVGSEDVLLWGSDMVLWDTLLG